MLESPSTLCLHLCLYVITVCFLYCFLSAVLPRQTNSDEHAELFELLAAEPESR